MQEIFYEESVSQHDRGPARRRYILFTVFGILCIIMAVALLINFIWTPYYDNEAEQVIEGAALSLVINGILIVVMIAGAVLLLVKRHNFYVSYDYTFISGELRIGKVYHGRKRKPLYRIGDDKLIVMGRVDSPTYRKLKASPDVKEDVLTPNTEAEEDKEFFYICAMTNVGKRILVLECRTALLSAILRYTRKNLLESEFNQK